MKRASSLLLGIAAASAAAPAAARVTDFIVEQRIDVPAAQPVAPAYVILRGHYRGALDPADPHNRIIADLSHADRLPDGKVGYSATFAIALPRDARAASGFLLYDVPNRGSGDVAADPDGHIRVVSGWQGDIAPQPGVQTLTVPIALGDHGRPLTGWVLQRFTDIAPGTASVTISGGIGRPTPRPAPLSLNTRRARLFRQSADSAPPTELRPSDWAFANCRDRPFPGTSDPHSLCVRGAFARDQAYTLVYRGKDPQVLGIGFAAVRDLNAFLRHADHDDAGHANPVAHLVRWSIITGTSQSGNFVRSLIALGFNADEAGRIVFDGANPNIAARQVPLNIRFGVPGGAADLYEPGSEGALWWSRYDDRARGRGVSSLLDRCTASRTCPRIIETFGSSEFWGLRMSPNLVGTDARTDLPLPANVRRYYFPSVTHNGSPTGGFPLNGDRPPPGADFCTLAWNPNPSADTRRAVLKALRDWVSTGTAPPPSRYPTIAHGDLVAPTAAAMGWPAIPGAPSPTGKINRFLDYDFGPGFDYVDLSGVITRQPPMIRQVIPSLVPRVDADGNEMSGIPSVQLLVPIGTYTGWNVRKNGYGAGGGCAFLGGFIPFVRTRADRLATGDPRLSLQERYGDHARFVARVRSVAARQVRAGWLLGDDAAKIVQQAEEAMSYADATRQSTATAKRGRTTMNIRLIAALALSASILAASTASAPVQAAAQAAHDNRPWMNATLTPEARVALLVPRMTQDEKLALVFGQFATDFPFMKYHAPAGARQGSAGYVPGVPRLGIPPQWQTDAGIGVATQGAAVEKRARTALPSNLATAATWNPALGYRGGAMIGSEARASGFNVMLAGGVNLTREPRNGRNFEYGGEDPLLAGTMVGAQIAGVQSNHIISTVKHYAINDQETDRNAGNSVIDHAAAHQSDLLAFEIAIDKGDPGSVMCSYNRVNGPFSCENPWLLSDVLRKEWGFKGYVMSDWGGTHSTAPAIAAGLDQESGFPFDKQPYFGADLMQALVDGKVSTAQLDTMVSRILYAMFKHGMFDHPVTSAPMTLPAAMMAKDAAISRADAEEAIVLMKNDDHLLPLAASAKRIVVIGGHADKGVLAGGGSSLVYPQGGNAVPDAQPATWPGPVMYYPSPPLEALRRQVPQATISFVDGSDPAAAAAAARNAEVAIVFATQWAGEGFDVSLTLADRQDALIDAVAAANRKTVVVLETGGPVLTPWADKVGALVEAWFPGTAGGEAIADVLTGRVNPSGHLPVTFPRSLDQLPHPAEPAKGDVVYSEGPLVGYKWYDAKQQTPAFAFGHGLSYTSFSYTQLRAQPTDWGLSARFILRNDGNTAGMAVAQLYAAGPGWREPKRLVAFTKLELKPRQSRDVTLTIDPRLLANYDAPGKCWRLKAGTYRLMLGNASDRLSASTQIDVRSPRTKPGFCPA